MDMNKVEFIGRVVEVPITRWTPSGRNVCTVRFATNRKWKNAEGQQQEAADFHTLVVWGKLGEVVQKWATKGRLCYVEGRISYEKFEGDDGLTKYFTKIVVREFNFLGNKPAENNGEVENAPEPQDGDDIPF
ncbi:MAG: single-stranded DNA-binding protein [Desulfobacterales bacterium]|nr:single-stranded DNA-binding protein [Desulfobacterales bacterium]